MKPTRQRPELSTTVALSVSSLPCRTRPSRFTCSYSDARVKRRAFEKENESAGVMSFWISVLIRHSYLVIQAASVQQKSSPEGFQEKTSRRGNPINLWSRRRLSRRFRCCSGRFCCRCRTGCFSGRSRRTRGCRACRGFSCLGLLLARRKERGTSQDADVFFHSVNLKRHIGLIG